MNGGTLALIVVGAAAITAGSIIVLRPLLARYALARPNARSSHREPTPQGGGIAVVVAVIVVGSGVVFGQQLPDADAGWLALLFGATLLIAILGAIDDIRPIDVTPRLLLQAIAVTLMLAALPSELRVVAALPWWLERALMLIAGLWFVNLTNFMDGIDWMTVVEVVPITAGLAVIGFFGILPMHVTAVALALCGAILGFAPFNKPVARLFLGDVGSLPIGLLMAWLLVTLAASGYLAAALLLPFYYGADATLTLARRLRNGHRAWEAHRDHYYQRATTGGFTVPQVIARVLAINVLLVLLALATVHYDTLAIDIAALAVAVLAVGWLLRRFVRDEP
jgi:UDP-N-acetylmuramyl pentapeptide phosphotransferase/UDP-N-acetylglucosamine-1-phosphate transferase